MPGEVFIALELTPGVLSRKAGEALDDRILYLITAEALLVRQALFVGFVRFGLILIFIGKWVAKEAMKLAITA